MIVFDIGANIGAWALANKNPNKKIISVEASPKTYKVLCDRVRTSTSIIPLNYAVCASDTSSITFYHCIRADTLSTLNKDWLTSSKSRFGNYSNSIQEIQVPTITLDTLIQKYGLPDLIKIDVEGAENIVLASLSQRVPMLCFEWAAEWRETSRECIAHLASLGFTHFHIQAEDKYDYLPPKFDKTKEEVLSFLASARDKVDWGMVWAK
jgi:FkbM family methyltransferase